MGYQINSEGLRITSAGICGLSAPSGVLAPSGAQYCPLVKVRINFHPSSRRHPPELVDPLPPWSAPLFPSVSPHHAFCRQKHPPVAQGTLSSQQQAWIRDNSTFPFYSPSCFPRALSLTFPLILTTTTSRRQADTTPFDRGALRPHKSATFQSQPMTE